MAHFVHTPLIVGASEVTDAQRILVVGSNIIIPLLWKLYCEIVQKN